MRQNVVMGDAPLCWASQQEQSVLEGGHWKLQEFGLMSALAL
jgi:hypothetical protein